MLVSDMPYYPDTEIRPAEVRDPSWDAIHKYTPIAYTSPEVLAKPEWADPDISGPNPPRIASNVVGKDVDRTSYVGIFDVHKGLPRNPLGRTGIAGRGCLGRWGPNHSANVIFTRFARRGGQVLNDNGQPILQVLTLPSRIDAESVAFVNGFIGLGGAIPPSLRLQFNESSFTAPSDRPELDAASAVKAINDMFMQYRIISEVNLSWFKRLPQVYLIWFLW